MNRALDVHSRSSLEAGSAGTQIVCIPFPPARSRTQLMRLFSSCAPPTIVHSSAPHSHVLHALTISRNKLGCQPVSLQGLLASPYHLFIVERFPAVHAAIFAPIRACARLARRNSQLTLAPHVVPGRANGRTAPFVSTTIHRLLFASPARRAPFSSASHAQRRDPQNQKRKKRPATYHPGPRCPAVTFVPPESRSHPTVLSKYPGEDRDRGRAAAPSKQALHLAPTAAHPPHARGDTAG